MDGDTCHLIVMVGLPARGKSFIASRLSRYLKWIGYDAKIFNAGTYRRKMSCFQGDFQSHEFFNPENKESVKKRMEFVEAAFKDMQNFLDEKPRRVGVFDATNTTRARREWVLEKVKTFKYDCKVFFIESICDDPETIENRK